MAILNFNTPNNNLHIDIYKLKKIIVAMDLLTTDKMEKDQEEFMVWQHLALTEKECIIIASNGDYPTAVDAVPKLHGTSTTESKLRLLMKELDVMQEKIRQCKHYRNLRVYLDLSGAQMSKSYYLKKIEQLMQECEQPGGNGVACMKNIIMHIIIKHEFYSIHLVHWSWRERDWQLVL